MNQYKVLFKPNNEEVLVTENVTIMEALNEAAIYFDFPCGGKGKCGKCRVKILDQTAVSLPTHIEKQLIEEKDIQAGVRLACVTNIEGPMVVDLSINQDFQHQILHTSDKMVLEVKPHTLKTYLQVKTPSLDEPLSDWQRLKTSLLQERDDLEDIKISLLSLYKLPENLRMADHRMTVVTFNNEVIAIEQGDSSQVLYGMAFDIGTTTIVGYLINLQTGEELAVVSTINPQSKFGADVISRITYASEEKGLAQLHLAVIEAINKLITEANFKAGRSREDIYLISIAGNTTMDHLFLGISPKYLSTAPYVSVINDSIQLDAKILNININPAGKILLLPNIGGFVGADTVAVLVATEMEKSDNVKLMIDIGTNGEIVLGSKKSLYSCSAAAGPAFEGAEITFGMRGAEGAIDHVFFKDNLEYSVIGNGKPKGICGSALLDIVAGLIEVGIVNRRGKLLSPDRVQNPIGQRFINRLFRYKEEEAFLVVEDSLTEHGQPIVVTQGDIRQLQLAKGAMVSGIKILMNKLNITTEEISEVLLAGAFGNYMNPHSASVIGLIPRELEGRIKMIGNAAGLGSKMTLLSTKEYARATAIAKSVRHVELASYPDFRNIFAKSTYF